MRCPECLKLYTADLEEITERHPKFQCQNCQMRFWVAYPESLDQGEILGYPLEWMESSDSDGQNPYDVLNESSREPQRGVGENQGDGGKDRVGDREESWVGDGREDRAENKVRDKVEGRERGENKTNQGRISSLKVRQEVSEITAKKPRFPRWLGFMGLFCVVLIAIGLIVPGLRNLVGIGVAVLFLLIAMYRFLN